MLEDCENCSPCLNNCPTGAITSQRFLLHAERCITFHYERPVDVPFLAWIDSSWHHCPVGCMRCQSVCPQNIDFLSWIEPGAEFSEEETSLLLQLVSLDQLLTATVKKMERIDMIDLLDVFPRNLRVFLKE